MDVQKKGDYVKCVLMKNMLELQPQQPSSTAIKAEPGLDSESEGTVPQLPQLCDGEDRADKPSFPTLRLGQIAEDDSEATAECVESVDDSPPQKRGKNETAASWLEDVLFVKEERADEEPREKLQKELDYYIREDVDTGVMLKSGYSLEW